jgi:putative protease
MNVSHREFSTGFYFGDPKDVTPTSRTYAQSYRYMGRITARRDERRFEIDVKNSFATGDTIEYIGPNVARIVDSSFTLEDRDGNSVERLSHQGGGVLVTTAPVEPGFLIRRTKR